MFLFPLPTSVLCVWLRSIDRLHLRGAESRVGLGAAGSDLGGDAGSHGAGDGVTGAGGALQGLLGDHLPQRVLLLYLEDVWLLCFVVTDTAGGGGGGGMSLNCCITSLFKCSLSFINQSDSLTFS